MTTSFVKCSACAGSGRVRAPAKLRPVPCRACEGLGLREVFPAKLLDLGAPAPRKSPVPADAMTPAEIGRVVAGAFDYSFRGGDLYVERVEGRGMLRAGYVGGPEAVRAAIAHLRENGIAA